MLSKSFDKCAAHSAIIAGVTSFLYAVSFLFIARSNPSQGVLLSALFLFLTGLFLSVVYVELYQRLRETNPGYALWAFILGQMSALGMLLHGGYDLSNALHSVVLTPAMAILPSPVDPRGLLTFGAASMAIFVFSWLMSMSKKFPVNLSYLGYLTSVLLMVLYIGRLVIVTPSSPLIAYTAMANGLVVGPLFYLWLGIVFYKK